MTTFVEAVALYLEQGGDPRFLGRFDEQTVRWTGLIGYFATTRLVRLGQLELDRAAATLLRDASAATRNRQIYTPFIAIWNAAVAAGLCDCRPFRRPRGIGNRRKRWATLQEIERLIAAAPSHIKPLITFLTFTGARMAEALELDWGDVDLESRWGVLRHTKRNGEDRGIPLHPVVVEALATMRHRDGRVFLTHRGLPYADRDRLAGGQIKTAWRATCVRAGLARWEKERSGSSRDRLTWIADPIVPHGLRHTFSTWLTVAGTSEQVRDEIMGHASTKTSAIYSHVARQQLIDAVDKLDSGGISVQSGNWRVAKRKPSEIRSQPVVRSP
jgi:integrase